MTALSFDITGIWEADATTIDFHGRVEEPTDDDITVGLNASRTASVTVDLEEDVAGILSGLPQVPYAICLRGHHAGSLKFRGVVNRQTIDLSAGTMRLDAIDPSLRMIRHFLRRGDLHDTLGQAELRGLNGDQGWVSVDHRGLRALRDAANTEGFAPLGIVDGYNDAPESSYLIGVSRGDQVFEKFLAVVNAGPDFDIVPYDGDAPGIYAYLNTYEHLGYDQSDFMAFHHGAGLNNIDGMQLVAGERYTNLVHAIDADAKFRVTRANATTLARTGPYLDWVSTGFTSGDGVTDATTLATLQAHADGVLAAEGAPSRALTVTLPPESEFGKVFGEGYYLGDLIPCAGRAGSVDIPEELYRVIGARLRHVGEEVVPELTLAAAAAGTIDDTDA